jgi:enamine deaminase RidA (YjgF/YER057c/UK114 family)
VAILSEGERRLVSSGGPWEARYGYSRVVVAGNMAFVAGTTDAGPDGRSPHPGDLVGQARAVLEIIGRALTEAGFSLSDVVRTRMFVTDRLHIEPVAEVHGEIFRDVRPASTALVVAALIDPSLLVEIEAEAVRVEA